MAYDKTKKEKEGKKLYREKLSFPLREHRAPVDRTARPEMRYRDRIQGPLFTPVVEGRKVQVGWKFVAALRKPCPVSARAGVYRKGRTELLWIGEEAARLFNKRGGVQVKPGPTLRLCVAPNQPGLLVPVRDPTKAARLARDFQRCAETKSSAWCAAKVQQRHPKAQLGGLGGHGAVEGLSLMDRLRR